MILKVNGQEYPCSKAEKSTDAIKLYDEAENTIIEFSGISNFDGYILEGGEFEKPQPPLELMNRADIDYIAIMSGVEL